MPVFQRKISCSMQQIIVFVVGAAVTSSMILSASAATSSVSDIAQQRMSARPWYTKSIEIGGVNCILSPATIIVTSITLFYVYYAAVLAAPKPSHVIASHILLKDHSIKSKEKLETLKAKIGTDFDKFAKMAAQISECPSSQNGGTLGRFRPGDMVPPFDKVVFDEASPVRSTLGPIQTQFGWHLIYVQDRFIQKK